MKKIIYFVLLSFILIPYTVYSQWIPQNSGVMWPLRGISFIDANIGTIVGDLGVIIKTTDGGITWISQSSGTTEPLRAVSFFNENIGTVVGFAGTILRTIDGGDNWVTQTSGTGYDLMGVSFLDEENGIVVGGYVSQGLILKTTNGGNTWETSLMVPVYLRDLCLTDTLYGTVVGDYGTILRTTDGGDNWISQTSGTTNLLSSVYFTDSNAGWIVGDYGTILKTTDGGDNWIFQNGGTTNWLGSVYFTDSNTGWTVGGPGTILKTTDGGDSWTSQLNGFFDFLVSVFFIDSNTGWAVGFMGAILSTINGGTPVELTSFTAEAVNNNVILRWTTATELNNNIFEIQRRWADNKFSTVGFIQGEGTTTNKHNYSYIDNDLVNGKYFYRLKQIDFNGTYNYSNVVEVDVINIRKYEMVQNFPNPFNPSTIIKYSLPRTSKVVISVYDILGNEIETVVNEEKPAGTYEINWNAADLPGGVYFYSIQAGEFVQTKKMVLLK